MKDYSKIITKLIKFLQTEVQKRGFQSVVFGLSGGIDSAVVAVLCKKAFGSNIQGLLMPSLQSSKSSLEDALELCKAFDISSILSSIGKSIN